MKIPQKANHIQIQNGHLTFYSEAGIMISQTPIKDSCFDKHSTFSAMSCDCSGHLLTLSVFDDEEDDLAYLSIWTGTSSVPLHWRDRLRHLWRILWVGTPYEDQFVMSLDGVRFLRTMVHMAETKLKDKQDAKAA